MARMATNSAAALALFAALAALAACTTPEPSTASTVDSPPAAFRWRPPRMRAPSAERPAWLPLLPADLPRIPAPDVGFRG